MTQKKIFISYSDLDKDKMRLIERIINEHKDKLIPIIIADNRKALIQLTEKVSKGIIDCDFFIPIITNKSINTQWINQEIGYAKAINRRIIPIIESQIIDNLKGFIHKQLDLSYNYEAYDKYKPAESKRFFSIAKVLINDILNELNSNELIQVPKNKTIKQSNQSYFESLGNIKILENKQSFDAKYGFNMTIDNSILKSNIGTISIWAYISDIHNIIDIKKKYKYIISSASNKGQQIENPSLARYPNAWAICRITPTNENHFGSWRFWCNNIYSERNVINYKQLISSGWHLFSICWSQEENYIKFLIDEEIVGESEFKLWPSDLTGSFHLGTWPNRDKQYYFDSHVGPYKLIYAGYDKNLLKNIFEEKPY